MSVTPVRIALRELAKEGIVETRPHGGVRVAELSLEELEELYATRVGIESWLARLGAPRLTAADTESMQKHFADAERFAAAGDRHGFLEAAWLCRRVVYRAAGRPRLFEQIDLLFRRTARYNELALYPEDRFEGSLSATREFRDACVEGDGAAAQHAIRVLLDRSLQHLVEQLPSLQSNA